MAFSRDDLKIYESQKPAEVPDTQETLFATNPEVLNPEAPSQVDENAEVDAAIAASVTEPTAKGTNDGSTTANTAEPVAATSPDPEGVKDPDLEDLTDGKPRSRAQERIEELVAERNALRKYGEYLLAQVEATRKAPQQVDQSASQPTVNDTKEDPAPTMESAEYDPVKLTKLQNEWLDRQLNKRVESAVKQLETRQNEVAIRQTFEQRSAEFKKTAPDYEIVIANPALPQLAPNAAKIVVKSENGPAVIYHLGKNPDLAVRIARMDPESQAHAIGRLEEQLIRAKTETKNTTQEPSKQETKPAVKPAVVTKAPPPIKPVSSGTSVTQKPADIMSMEEWVAADRARKIADKEARKKMRTSMR